ncbi:PulJ/GspJ family protein [Euzebya rosea]|uniref:PulJ/GspJ family protein n=1 Tax=Euzebya rosea TaxID=2052804 RepID=UPI00130092DB|nr:type II secretion system protein [Euzebya rosea]
MTALRHALERREDDHGFSLVELLVGISILAIVGTIVTSTMIITMQTGQSVENTAASTSSVRTAEARVLSMLRSAVPPSSSSTANPPAIIAGADYGIRFYSQHGRHPSSPALQVLIYVDPDGRLIERVTTPSGSGPDWTYSSTNSTERIIATGLTDRSIFSYYDQVAPSSTPMTLSGQLTAAQRETVVSVRVEMSLDADDNPRTGPVTISSRIELRNLT